MKNKLLVFLLSIVAMMVIVGCVPPQEKTGDAARVLVGEATSTAPTETVPTAPAGTILTIPGIEDNKKRGSFVYKKCEELMPADEKIGPLWSMPGVIKETYELIGIDGKQVKNSAGKVITTIRYIPDECDGSLLTERFCDMNQVYETPPFNCTSFGGGLKCVSEYVASFGINKYVGHCT